MKKLVIIGIIVLCIAYFLSEKGGGPNVSQNGISTYMLADQIMKKYDINSDNMLDVSTESFLRNKADGVTKTESRGLLFTDADQAGNADGVVSESELEDFLGEFDTNGDGEITTFQNIFHSLFTDKSEWAEFDERYGERFKYSESS